MTSWIDADLTGRTVVSDAQRRKAYLHRAYEEGFADGESGRLRTQASYFENGDEEALAQYRKGLRIGRRERGQA